MIFGVDEAGRGPVIGPLVVAGVAVPRDEERILREMGVRDSKKISPGRRQTLADEIKRRWPTVLEVVSPEDIDVLRERMTLNELEAGVFASVIERLVEEAGGMGEVYVDAADANERHFELMVRARLGERWRATGITSRHKADEIYPVVSAASIVAKVERDRRIAEIEREIGVPIGSGYPSDPTTRVFLKEWVMEHGSLPPHTRTSWKTAKKILDQIAGPGVAGGRIDEY
ncbi:MAG: ribonuclease HII [Thermoplasmata archaeon]|nr:ribonuclease HII [Thermoplasmata archaeon]